MMGSEGGSGGVKAGSSPTAEQISNDVVDWQPQTCSNPWRIGDFILGPKMSPPPFSALPIQNYLARKEHTDGFYVIKIMTLQSPEEETVLDVRAKILLHTEHSILSLLEGVPGVVHGHGLHKESFRNSEGQLSGKEMKRVALVMDCFLPHDFSPKYKNILNLWEHIGKETRLKEGEAIRIFYKVAETLNRMHKLNIIHRDLKPTNIILNRDTDEVSLTGFCLGHHLIGKAQLLTDRRGTLAILPPEVLMGLPYYGKPSDAYSLGVLLFTMIFGKPPFSSPDLTKKITSGVFRIPEEITDFSSRTLELIMSLMHKNWAKRPTVERALEEARGIMADEEIVVQCLDDSNIQVVPELHHPDEAKSDMSCNFDQFSSSSTNMTAAEIAVAHNEAEFGHRYWKGLRAVPQMET